MSVTLTPHIENRIRQWIESGRYATVDETLEAAVRFRDEHDRLTRCTPRSRWATRGSPAA